MNPRPSDYKSDALPTELRQLKARRGSFRERCSHRKSGVRESNPCKSAWKADARPLGQPRTTRRRTIPLPQPLYGTGVSAVNLPGRQLASTGFHLLQFRRSSLRAARTGHVSACAMRNDREPLRSEISAENSFSRSYKNLIWMSRRSSNSRSSSTSCSPSV